MQRALLLSLALALPAGAVLATPLVNTFGAENASALFWGLPDTAAYGQTFTLEAATPISNVSFRIGDDGTAIGYMAYVFAWDSSRAAVSGDALFSAAGSTAGVNRAMTTYTVETGGLALGPGMYVAFLEATSPGAAVWGATDLDAYAGGTFVYQNNGGDTTQLSRTAWGTDPFGAQDLSFAINGVPAAVPVAPALPLLATGVAALAVLRRRRRAG